MAVSALARLALRAPAPVHAAIGADGWRAVDDLSLSPGVRLEPSVRHAGILLVAGRLRDEDLGDLRRLHDQMPHPRATVFWREGAAPPFEASAVVAPEEDPSAAIARAYRDLLSGDLRSEPDLQPDEPPNPWRGEGDFGQGGEGMMGGTPYGRPMAMTDDDLRDGLALDAYTAEFGPFLSVFPPGLKLEITLQGDVIQTARVLRPPYLQAGLAGPSGRLRLIARQLRLLGLTGHAVRTLRAAASLDRGETPDVARLRRFVDWSGIARAVPAGLGTAGDRDVRARLAGWWRQAGGAPADDAAAGTRLVDLLPGLEWHEATLVINSFDPATLAGMCPVENQEGDDGGDGAAEHHHGHGDH